MGAVDIEALRAEVRRIKREDAMLERWLAEKPSPCQRRALLDVGTRKFNKSGFKWCIGAPRLPTDLAAIQPQQNPDGSWKLFHEDAQILMMINTETPILNRALTDQVRGSEAETGEIKSHTDRLRKVHLIQRVPIKGKVAWLLTPSGLAEQRRRHDL